MRPYSYTISIIAAPSIWQLYVLLGLVAQFKGKSQCEIACFSVEPRKSSFHCRRRQQTLMSLYWIVWGWIWERGAWS